MEKLNLIVLNILNTNELFNFDWKFDEDSFKVGIPLDANSYFYRKAPSWGLLRSFYIYYFYFTCHLSGVWYGGPFAQIYLRLRKAIECQIYECYKIISKICYNLLTNLSLNKTNFVSDNRSSLPVYKFCPEQHNFCVR